MVHVTYDISLGSILTALTVVGVGLKFHSDWVSMLKEHRLMWLDYCQRHRIRRDVDFKPEKE